MAAGIPTIVADVDAFHELPEAAIVKIQIDADPAARLAEVLAALLGDPQRQAQVGAEAQRYIATQASPRHVAAEYVSFIAEQDLTKPVTQR